MPRQKNAKPTNIYWLSDARTGLAFYCGKTVAKPIDRLSHHFSEATHAPNRPVLRRLVELGRDNVRIDVVEIVPSSGCWSEREKFWVRHLRLVNPECLNVSDGGAGAPGLILSDSTRAKMSASNKGKTHTAEVRLKMKAIASQRMASVEAREQISAKLKGRRFSEETLVKMKAAQKRRFAEYPKIVSLETRAKMSASRKGKPGRTGRIVSAETRAKISASNKGKKRDVEARSNISAAQKQRPPCSPETLAKRSAAMKKNIQERRRKFNGSPFSSGALAKMTGRPGNKKPFLRCR